MKLPLRWGLLLLLGIWALHSYAESDAHRMVLLVVGMGVALWTAFSLKIPPRKPGDVPSLWPQRPGDGEPEDPQNREAGRGEGGEGGEWEAQLGDGDTEPAAPDKKGPGPNGGKPMN